MYSKLCDEKPTLFYAAGSNPELSNFSGCIVYFYDNWYPSAEHAYVAWRLDIHGVSRNILTIYGCLATFTSFREKYNDFCASSVKLTLTQKKNFEKSMFGFWANPEYSKNRVGIIAKMLCSKSDPVMVKFRKWLELPNFKPEKKPNTEEEMSDDEKAVWKAIHQSKFSDDDDDKKNLKALLIKEESPLIGSFRGKEMKAALLDTKNSLLIEFDKGAKKGSFWGGMVSGGINNLKPDPETGKYKVEVQGKNVMGMLLQERRSELQSLH